jgi:CP family cyanate transporter-like MFS transporter
VGGARIGPVRGGRPELNVTARHAALALGGLFVAALVLRPQVVGVGPILERMRDDLDMSHGVAGLLATIPVLCMGLFAPPAAYLAARVGAARAVTIAMALIAVAGLLRAVSPTAALVILMTVPIGVGMGLGNALMPVAVKERFADHALRATSVYAVGIQVGATAGAALAVPLADAGGGSDGWRLALGAFSVAAGVCLLVWLLIARRQDAPRPARAAAPPRLPWRSPGAWHLAAIFLLVTILFYGLGAWLSDVLVEEGWSESAGGAAVALLNAATVCATIVVGLIGGRARSRRQLLVVAALLLLAGTSGIALAPDGGWAWAALCGSGIGVLFPVTMSLPVDVASRPESVGAVAGLMLLVGYVGAAPAPAAFGALRDWTGSYTATTIAFVVTACAVLTVVALASRERLHRGVP